MTKPRRNLLVAAVGVAAVLAAIPVTAYVIVPQFVRSRVVERAPVPPSSSPSPAATPAVVAAVSHRTRSGDLVRLNAVDFGTGKVVLLPGTGGRTFLRFDNVEIAAAPAMHVYLSDRTDGQPGTFTDLGPLRATSGSFNYEVPASVDLASVHSVVAWCKQFSTVVTYAVLQPE